MKTKKYAIWAFVLLVSVLTIWLAGQAIPDTEQTAEEKFNKWLKETDIKLLKENVPEWFLDMSQDEKGLHFLKEYFTPFTPEQFFNMQEDEFFTMLQYDQQEWFKGLRGVSVLVEYLQPEAEKYGLTREAIQTDTELQLRRHGIKVIPDEGKSVLDPLLYINVNTVIVDNLRVAAVNIIVEVKEFSMLCRNPKIATQATTWSRGSTMLLGLNKLRNGVRERVQDFVDEFINDYFAANPPQQPTGNNPKYTDLTANKNNLAPKHVMVSAISYTADNPCALIDGQIKREGDTIYGTKIVKIYEDRVEFEKDGNTWTQKIGEAPNPNWE